MRRNLSAALRLSRFFMPAPLTPFILKNKERHQTPLPLPLTHTTGYRILHAALKHLSTICTSSIVTLCTILNSYDQHFSFRPHGIITKSSYAEKRFYDTASYRSCYTCIQELIDTIFKKSKIIRTSTHWNEGKNVVFDSYIFRFSNWELRS